MHRFRSFTSLARRLESAEYLAKYRASIANPDAFWAQEARQSLLWRRDFDTTSRNDPKNGVC